MNEETLLTEEELQQESLLPAGETAEPALPAEEASGSEVLADAAEESPKNLWDDPDFPKTDWKCTGITDLGKAEGECQLCGQKHLRYVHHMTHPSYGDLDVGCTCAGKMEGDVEGAKQREREFKRQQHKKRPDAKLVTYADEYYLRYGEGKRTAPMDLEGTIAFLRGLGFTGGELRQAREGKNRAEDFRNANKNKNNQMFCSYCGSEIAGVEFYRLPDGRMRCTTCSSTVVKTKAEVEVLCQRVLNNLDSFFGATIDVPVSIEVTDERKLKKKVGVPIGTRDSQSLLILGVAINKKKKYSIILENGAPRISLIATFAHELTHIWQYTHWDNKPGFKKCSKKNRLLIYEGMAKWAEIQYLYLIGETNVARREEEITRARQDEYGIGFCMYEDRFPLTREAMTCEDTPFTPDRYPFD